jgi:flagellar FliJ protein
MPYCFSLQAVMDHRRNLEETAERELGNIQSFIRLVEGNIHQVAADISNRYAQVNEAMLLGKSTEQRQLTETWILRQKNHLHDLDGIRRQKQEELEEKRRALIEAMKQRTIIEKLQEKELEDYRRQESRDEQKMFDEIALREFELERNNRNDEEKDSSQSERIAS